ncbi:rhomboid family intramembrane serine protease [Psychroflexus planctonicus]|uniref:Rhomboid family intramembrane serine protease n=1 Tax=Psychroflexus planctonicus TaxID=1526575 RepID=A0ABQ1SFH7_9FLAO|nr:rhomboid family intramembrane serine protease [Psychroflexus planctonicus]GGE28175.1 rhomboid family intramembrane serine protease [Psychroflexus planctonicus]
MGSLTDTVKTLLIANIIFFVGTLSLGDYAFTLFALWFPENPNFGVWQIITHMFMHGNEAHIFFNMFALFIFGSVLERSIGQSKFIFIYISSGLGAAGLQILFSYLGYWENYDALIESGLSSNQISEMISSAIETGRFPNYINSSNIGAANSLISNFSVPMVGASGAIFGVLAAFALMYPNMPLYFIFVPIPIKAKYLIGGYFLIDLYSAITDSSILGPSNVAHWAHIGGAVVGFFIMWYWKKNSFNQNRWN